MGSLIWVLTVIGFLDGWTDLPIYIAPLIAGLTGARPQRATIMFIAGVAVAYLVFGAVAAVFLQELDNLLDALNETLLRLWNAPTFLEVCLQLLVGAALLFMAWRRLKRRAEEPEEDAAPASTGTKGTFAVGVSLALAGLPAAAPYLGAVSQVLRAQLSIAGTLSLVILYNVVYLLPLLCFLAVQIVFKEASRTIFERMRHVVAKWTDRLIVAGLGILGALLTVDGILWFFGESPMPY